MLLRIISARLESAQLATEDTSDPFFRVESRDVLLSSTIKHVRVRKLADYYTLRLIFKFQVVWQQVLPLSTFSISFSGGPLCYSGSLLCQTPANFQLQHSFDSPSIARSQQQAVLPHHALQARSPNPPSSGSVP